MAAHRIPSLFCSSFLLCLLITVPEGLGFSSSVPPTRSVCRDLKPGHQQHKMRTDVPPYSVSTNVKTVSGGDDLVVILSGDSNNPFLGFYIQARDDRNNTVGTFVPSDEVKVHNCGGIRNLKAFMKFCTKLEVLCVKNAAHHANGKIEKARVQVTWKAPKSFQGPVYFLATFVKEYDTFWTKIKSPEVVTVTDSDSE